MDLSLNNNHNEQNKECHSRTSFQSESTLHFSSTNYQIKSNSQSNLYSPEITSHSLEFEKLNVGVVDTTSNIKSPDIAFSPATTPYFSSTNYQSMLNEHSNLYLSETASHPLKFEQSDVGVVETTSNIKSPDIAFSPATTPYFSSTNYQSMSNAHSNLYLSETASHPLKFEQSDVGAVDTTSIIKSPVIDFLPDTTPHFYSTDYPRMSNAHSNLYLLETTSHPLKFEQPDVGVVETTSNIKSLDIAFSLATTPHFYSTNYPRMSNAHSNLYLSEIASHPLKFEQSDVGVVETTSNIKSLDIAFSPATTQHFYSTNYQKMSNAHSNLYLSETASHPLKFEQSDVGVVDTTSNIKSLDIAFSPSTTPHFYSTNYPRMSNAHSNLYLSETASHPLKFKQSNVGVVDTTSNIKSLDIAFSPSTTPHFYSTNYPRMSNAHSNLYLSETASHPLKFKQSNVRVVDTTSNIKSLDIAFSPSTTPHFYSTNYPRMSNAHSNLYLSETASHPLKFKQSNVRVVETTSNIKSPDIAFSSATTSNFYSTNYQRIRAIKTTEESSPFNSLFLPLTTSYSSSINNKGISPKVIEYVLECQKKTDQSFVHRKDANSFMCNTDEYKPVDLTYAAITKNNHMSFEPPSIPNIQQISKPIRPNMLLKSNRELRRYIPTVMTRRLQPIEKKVFQESVHVYNFRQTNKQVESTSNIKRDDFCQISDSTNQPSHSMDEEYSSNTFHSQSIPNPASETPKNTLFGKYYMDIPMFPKLKVYSDELNQSLILKTALEKPENHILRDQ